jgi:hypothetical protein
MKRGQFLRSLFIVVAAPKVLAEVNIAPAKEAYKSSTLFSELNFVTPKYQAMLVEKYGNESYSMFLDMMSSRQFNKAEFYHYEKSSSADAAK